MATIITKAVLAERLGVSRARVSQMVARGLPVREDGKVDLEQAAAWVQSHTDRSRTVGRAPKPVTAATAGVTGPAPGSTGADAGHVLLVARARKAVIEARRMERLENLAANTVIQWPTAEQYAREFSHIVREAALSQADRLVDALMAAAATGDRDRVYRAIRDDNHRMLTQVAKAIKNAGLAND